MLISLWSEQTALVIDSQRECLAVPGIRNGNMQLFASICKKATQEAPNGQLSMQCSRNLLTVFARVQATSEDLGERRIVHCD